MISIVIPTFEESKNIEAMLRRTSEVLREAGEKYELIVVDDNSPDGTADLAEAQKDSCSVRVVRRAGRLGLATAVLDGWAAAKGDLLGVIDADLQHPPEVLVALARALRNSNAQVAVASRKVPGGGMKEWSRVRQFISWGSTRLAYVLLGDALAGTTDPLSGMFMVKADVVRGRQMRPQGYKILLEVLARGEYSKVTDVPYIFESRTEGESKLGPRQSWEYLAHLFQLSFGTVRGRMQWGYCAAALLGAGVNFGGLSFLLEYDAWPVWLRAVVAGEGGLLTAYLLNILLFAAAGRNFSGRVFNRTSNFFRYHIARTAGLLLNVFLFSYLLAQGSAFVPAALTGIGLGLLLDFNFLFFGIGIRKPASPPSPQSEEAPLMTSE